MSDQPPSPPRKARLLGIVGFVLLFALPTVGAALHYVNSVFVFTGLEGPKTVSEVPEAKPAEWTAFRREGASRLAILLTDESSAWLGLAHGLKALGVPFTITRDPAEALRHRVVLVYPLISGRVLAPEALRMLAAHPRGGGTLIAANVLGGGLEEVFGFRREEASRKRYRLDFSPAARGWLGLTEKEEQALHFGDPAKPEAQLGTHGYVGAGEALAAFDDGTAAITRRRIGTGAAYALGFDPGFLLLTGQNARGTDLEQDYVNAYAPQGDVLLRMLRQIWREGEPLAAGLGRVPGGKALAAMMTFDVDYTRSLPNAVAYAEALKEQGVRGTFFVQTKYVRDYNDAIILNDETAAHLRRLGELGMELASHSVSHAYAFRDFELGTGREQYPAYQPRVVSRNAAEGGTILGELRVSKFLLESLAPPAEVVSFRPGHLANPTFLPQALEAAGYRYGSSVTAGISLTHLPFRLKHTRGSTAETGVFEFPITVEDERSPLMGLRLPQAVDLGRKIGRDGGIFVVLIHPNILGHKLEFARGIVEALKPDAWFGGVADFGAWWSARDRVELDVVERDGQAVLRLSAPLPIKDLAVELPAGWRPAGPASAPRFRETRRGLVFDHLEGGVEIALRRAETH
ncbi:MAG TPA: polysaccharide deacetylase family protein [Microvirga sp.]|jgi:hypothetical protein|nr:polysaccharide deacetylase family protein [Microvirga sp.]